MVSNALTSIKKLNYDNWHLAFIDDNSKLPGEPIVKNYLKNYLNKITFYNTNSISTTERSYMGYFMNEAIKNLGCDLAIILCDDDALHPDYFTNLEDWFNKNHNYNYCYSNLILYNPLIENYNSLLGEHLIINNKKLHRTKNFNV